ncbi:MAG: universal stress protein [Sutterella wadsworthensis]
MPTSESLKRIAICLDESDQSLRVQGFFTEHVDLFEQGTSFTLIHVQKSAEDEQANGFAETGTIANEVESILTRAGMNVSTKTLYGDVGDVIAEHAEEENYDMIVMGSHGYSSVSATLLGSVTMTVASECEVPLLIVR